jgi:hypothetical protein
MLSGFCFDLVGLVLVSPMWVSVVSFMWMGVISFLYGFGIHCLILVDMCCGYGRLWIWKEFSISTRNV